MFLISGDPEFIEEMVANGTPFGVADADGLILAEALKSRQWQISAFPAQRLELLRRFNTICFGGYPTNDLLADYMEVMQATEFPAVPDDIIAIILDLQWYKTEYTIDWNYQGITKGGLGKTEISQNREWLEIILDGHPILTDRGVWDNRESAIAAIHKSYLFLRERYQEVRREERWKSEAQLGDALARLFGKDNVKRHARPIWLNPQHLDFYLPQYRLAVEYMGLQHFKSVGIFGGDEALRATQQRDERKRKLCERMGVSLIYVNHDEDIGKRAREIHSEFINRPMEAANDPPDIA